jgi:transposase
MSAGCDPSGGEVSDEIVSAVVGQLRPGRPGGAGRGETWLELEGQHAFLKEKKVDDGLKLTKIRALLHRRGVEVPYRTLYRYCAAAFPDQVGGQRETVPVADGEPGQELQADFGRLGKVGLVAVRRRVVKGLVLSACVSCHQFCWPTYGESLPEVIEGFEEAWEFYGGVFRVLIVDNFFKAVVDRADPLNPRLNPAFLEYAQARGFRIDPCVVASPTQKPRVERAVPYCRDSGFAGEDFPDLLAARRGMRRWCLEEAGTRIHGTTQRRPLEHFLEAEQAHLLPAPTARYDPPVHATPRSPATITSRSRRRSTRFRVAASASTWRCAPTAVWSRSSSTVSCSANPRGRRLAAGAPSPRTCPSTSAPTPCATSST